ncbi:MAG: 50S ribosomal protein L19 [Gemmataceae bacterium]|nr:50S ribosomal protein L19 [Gemmataceae bacterium]
MKNKYMALVEQAVTRTDLPAYDVGDNVDIHQRILEGQKERVQIFSGTIIARKGAKGREMITVRRLVQGEGIERVFPVNSPRIAKIEVKRSGQTRRAKLYYLRDRVGKATKLREKEAKPTGPTKSKKKPAEA